MSTARMRNVLAGCGVDDELEESGAYVSESGVRACGCANHVEPAAAISKADLRRGCKQHDTQSLLAFWGIVAFAGQDFQVFAG